MFPNKLNFTHGGAQNGRLIRPTYWPRDIKLKQSILDSLIHLTWPILLRSLHSVFDSLQLSQFKGAAMLLSLSLSVCRSLSLSPPSPLPQIDGEGEKLMTHLSNQFTQLCHTQYLSKPMRGEETRGEERRGEERKGEEDGLFI